MRISLHLMAVLFATGAASPVSAQQAPDAARGLALARQWCAACHVVEPGGHGADNATAFPTVAAAPATTRENIVTFLGAPHGGMPDPGLTRRDAADIAEHILSLRVRGQ